MSKSESGTSQVESQVAGEKRDRWTSSFAFVMVALGSCIGLGSLWRFPTQCAEFGGGAFFVPYILGIVVVGLPISILEAGLGQIYRGSCIVVYSMLNKRFRMLGVAGCYLIFTVVTFYTSMIAYFVRMLVFSFMSNQDGNMLWDDDKYKYGANGAFEWVQDVVLDAKLYASDEPPHVVPAEHVTLVWQNVLCLMVVYLFVFLSVYFGTKVTAYVTYVAVILPVLFVNILFFHGLSLDGAAVGIYNYIGKWDMSVLVTQPSVWNIAVAQVLFSLNLTSGVLIVLASYQEKGRHITKNQFIIVAVNTIFSILTGFAIFAVLGNSAFQKAERLVDVHAKATVLNYNTTFNDLAVSKGATWETLGLGFYHEVNQTTYRVNQTEYQTWFDDICSILGKPRDSALDAKDLAYGFPFTPSNIRGPALVLGSYPAALSSMPSPHFFSVVFFLTLVFMGGDSIFGMVETMTAVLKDTQYFHDVSKKKINIVLLLVAFLCSLPYVTTNGFHMMSLTSSWVDAGLLSLGLAETVAAGWIYGISLTMRHCGKLCTALLPISIFAPVVFAVVGRTVLPEDFAFWTYLIALLVCAALLTITFVLLRRRGDMTLTYREKFASLTLNHLENLRNSMNATFLRDPLENRWYCGVPKYIWSFCIKFICPSLLLGLLINMFIVTGQDWNEENALPLDMRALALAISYLTPILIITGLLLPSRIFSRLVHMSYTRNTGCRATADHPSKSLTSSPVNKMVSSEATQDTFCEK